MPPGEGSYRDLYELAVDGILQGSTDGFITGANAQMQMLAGRSLEQLLGRHVSELFAAGELRAKPLRFDLLNAALPHVNERNGVGLPPDLDMSRLTSLGLRMAPDLARQMGGTLHLGSGPGTRFEVVFSGHSA